MIISQDVLVNAVCKKTGIDYPTTRLIFQAIEDASIEYLLKASQDEPVTIKLFSGLTLEGKYVPEKVYHTFEDFYCPPKIKAKAKFTKYFINKINKFQ